MQSFRIAVSCLLLFLLAGWGETAAANDSQRIVVIGDIHADIDAARAAFRLAGALDENDDWIGGELIVVQLGDLIGRSYDDREVLEFILATRKKADTEGGKVHVLIGNHEVFGARLELRWVHDRAFGAFDDLSGLDLDHPRLADLPPNKRARSATLMPGGYFARQLADFPVVLRLGKTIYVHGGVTPHWANYGIDRINAEVRDWFAGSSEQPLSMLGMDPGHIDDSVMMSRHFSQHVDADECALLEESLRILDAERMIVAHTVHESITARCDERVWAIDVGMTRFYGGSVQVLEILDDEVVTIISQ
jgi:hypothetical protein